ncbi:MAG: HK97 family phage prohead protease [Clostridia bacterium]|nr:HK97 family phage prohead protease [Clostridia bacterium]
MPMSKDREYRRINVTNLETRDEENGEMIVEGYATTFGQPYFLYGDARYKVFEEIDRNAFVGADMSDVIMQYDHEGRVFARNRNNTLELETDDHGLKIRAHLGGTEIGRQLYEEIKGGYTDKMSFGFTVERDQRTEERDEANDVTTIHRKILKFRKIYDVSAVSLPANDATEISARSLCEGVIAEAEQERLAVEERKRKVAQIRLLLEVTK